MSAIEITVVRRGGALVPASPMFAEDIEAIPQGKEVMCTVRMTRNARQHRLMFALLNDAIESGLWEGNVETLLEWLKIATGHVRHVIGQDGKTYLILKSISFASMDQLRFQRFFDRAIYVMGERWGIDPMELGRRARERAGEAEKAAA